MLSRDEIIARSKRVNPTMPVNPYTGTLNDPFQEGQSNYAGPGWGQFFGGLQKTQEDAELAGKNYRVGWGGFGNTVEGGDMMPRRSGSGDDRATSLGFRTERPGDEDIARTLAINGYLGNLTDQSRLNAQQLQQQQAQTDLAKTTAAGAASDLTDRQTMDHALTGGGPVDRARLLASVPGHLRPQIEAQLAASDAKLLNEQNDQRKLAETERHNRAGEAGSAAFVPPVDPATGAPLTGAAVLQTLSPAKQKLVQAVLEGRQAIPSGTALKDPYWKGILETANLVDPNFDTVNFNARANTRKDFTSGKAAGQINALNTVIGHLSDLAETGDKLGNTGMNWVNKIYNAITPGGSDRGVAINNFETLKEGVGTELMRVWRQAGAGSEKEIEDWKAQIGASKSPEELRGAFKTIGGMLESKLGALDSQYKQGMGTDKVSAIMPESRAKLDRLQGAKPAPAATPSGTIRARDPQGNLHEAKAGTPLPAGWKLEGG